MDDFTTYIVIMLLILWALVFYYFIWEPRRVWWAIICSLFSPRDEKMRDRHDR